MRQEALEEITKEWPTESLIDLLEKLSLLLESYLDPSSENQVDISDSEL